MLRYEGLHFHRVIDEFLMQSGDVTNDNGSGGECWMHTRDANDGLFKDENLKDFLPQEIEEFESTTDSCSFKISQLPKLSLHIIEKTEYSLIKLQSKNNQIDFHMYCHIQAIDHSSCTVILEINMELNLMMKMMVEKPINLFLEKLSEQIKKI